jgi:hypothetical protein
VKAARAHESGVFLLDSAREVNDSFQFSVFGFQSIRFSASTIPAEN